MDPLCPRETIKHAVAELRTQLVGSYLLDMEEWISIYSCLLSNLTRSFSFVTAICNGRCKIQQQKTPLFGVKQRVSLKGGGNGLVCNAL